MKKIKLILPTALALTAMAPLTTLLTSCNDKNKDIETLLKSMPNVMEVKKMTDIPAYQARYMITFLHPIDWKNKSKGNFPQRVEFDYRGKDRVNQLFTCGYELRNEKPDRMNDYEIANHFQGNIIKPEYRFYDKSRPAGLSNDKVDGWEYLTNTQAAEDFHSIITSFKTILTGKWAFTGTSKGGETTNFCAMKYPGDCDVYVPYVAPAFYQRGDHTFQQNVYGKIGQEVLGLEVAKEYQVEISKFQYYALKNRNTVYDNRQVYEWFMDSVKGKQFSDFGNNNPEIVYDVCIQECATAFWQYEQNISELKEFNVMPDDSDKLKECVRIATNLNDPSGWTRDSLFFPYYYQAATEMGEYSYNFKEMVEAIAKNLDRPEAEIYGFLKAEYSQDREDLLWKIAFTDEQYQKWIVNGQQDMKSAKDLKEWYTKCQSKVFMIYGGADTWTALGFPENGYDEEHRRSPNIAYYVGQDASNATGRTHRTRISTLSASQQKEIWAELDALLK